MSANIEGAVQTRVYTIKNGRTVIEQANNSIMLSAAQILAVIRELHACYDYCAAWKETTSDDITADTEVGS